MNKRLLIAGSVFGFLGVVLGAFGAHGLEKVLDTQQLATFETGVRYQMYHALLLLMVSFFALSEKAKNSIFLLLVVGIILFSGSIYGLATNELTSFNFKKIALLTPIGGTLLIVAWGMLIFHFRKVQK